MIAEKVKFNETVTPAARGSNHPLLRLSIELVEATSSSCCNKMMNQGEQSSANIVGANGRSGPSLRAAMHCWHLPHPFTAIDLTTDRLGQLQQDAIVHFQHACGVDGAESAIIDVIRSNLNFLSRTGVNAFSGLVFSTLNQFQFSPEMPKVTAYRLLQAALATEAAPGASLIHVHKAGEAPKTLADAKYIKHYLTKHRAGYPGVRTKITLFRGAPYLISVISRSASDALNETHELKPEPANIPVPTSTFVGFKGRAA